MTYIMSAWFISEIIMFAMIAVFVHLYISQSVELDIRSSLSRQINSLTDAIVSDNGELSVDESRIERRYPDMYIAIVDNKGNIVWGSAPEKIVVEAKKSIAPAKTMAGDVSYYYIDRDIKYTMSTRGFVRAYVSEKDILRATPHKDSASDASR